MNSSNEKLLTIEVSVQASAAKAWECMFQGEHIVNWNFASSDWHCPRAQSEIKVGGVISSRMEAKDGSFGFDFNCIIDHVDAPKALDYHLEDGRKVMIRFVEEAGITQVTEQFEPESENPIEMQQMGWQAILNNYKTYTEGVK